MSEARARPLVFDADGHIVEPPVVFEEYLDPRWRSWAPRALAFDDHFRYVCGDRLGFRIFNRPESVAAPGHTRDDGDAIVARGGDDPVARLADMNLDRIDAAALYPTYGLMIQGVTRREPALALCQAVNDWLADYCSVDPGRLLGVGTLPMTNPADAVAEARRCVSELGFCAVWRRPERFDGIPALHDPGYEPLWRFLEEADVPLAVHPGLNGVVPYEPLGQRFDDDFATMHAVHFPAEQMMTLTTLTCFGILDRHPNLRVALLESGAVWALPYLHRLDEHVGAYDMPASLSLLPSEYFARQCFVSVEEPEPALDVMLERYPHNVVFASDYPHGDCTFPGAPDELLESPMLTDDQLAAVMWGNACRLYGVEPVFAEVPDAGGAGEEALT